MIYDCFSFFNELDLLEIRLKTLDKVVDWFVISESNFTHTGKPKPLYYQENKTRFAQFTNRIIHVVSPDPENPARARHDVAYSWLCENIQRNATIRAIEPQLNDNDILIVSDLDEIPNPASVIRAIQLKCPVRLRQKLYYYYLNYRCCTTPFWDTGSVVLSYKSFRTSSTYKKISNGVSLNSDENLLPTATKVRFLQNMKIIRNGGWHFSYIGGVNKIITKLNSIVEGKESHMCDEESIRKCIASGNDIYGRGEWFFAEKMDAGQFPSIALQFPKLVFPVTEYYLRNVRFRRMLAYAKWLIRPIAWKLLPHNLAVRISKRFNQT